MNRVYFYKVRDAVEQLRAARNSNTLRDESYLLDQLDDFLSDLAKHLDEQSAYIPEDDLF